MTTIHDDGAGSESARMRAALLRERRTRALLGRTKDALEAVLGAGGVGFCRLRSARRRLIANPHFKAHFGWPPDAILERSGLEARVHEEDRAALAAAVDVALAQATPLELTVRALWPCGTTQYIALRGRCTLADAAENTDSKKRAVRELVLVANNVTAEHTALRACEAAAAREYDLRTRAEAERRSNLELLSLVSHELRSPLNALLGWTRILAIKRGDDPEVKAKTLRIERSARAQLRIVNDLLDFGHMGTGKFRIAARPMNLASVVRSALEASSAAAGVKDIQITADLAAGAGELNGDAQRLHQVVMNLLSNALKFTPAGGKIHMRLRRDGTELVLELVDTGQGIAPERLPQLFERAGRKDCGAAQGLGLGLPLVREIVALHGGRVRVTSEGVGRGTQVELRLPARASTHVGADPNVPKALQCVPRQLSGLAILVVDDDPDARTVVADLLQLEGAEVAACDSAAMAYRKLCAIGARFDVVVTDIGMPVEDGYSLVRKLRALKSGARVLAVALTGRATAGDAAAALEAGFDLHVAKPVDFESFVPMIRRCSPHV